MEDFPKTMLEFEKRFNSEESCLQYLYELRWPEGYICPKCGFNSAWHTKRNLYRCRKCDYQASVTAGTIFQDTRLPLQLWFRAIWQITSQKYGANALGLKRVLGIGSYQTAWLWLHKLRIAMVRPSRERLSGNIEIDETYLGGSKPGKRGRGALGKTLVMIATEVIENKIGRIRLYRLNDASSESLIGAIKELVESGSTICTDGWSGYEPLKTSDFIHNIVRQSSNIGDDLLPHTHRIAALLKRWLLGTYQGAVTPSHLDYYLDEYTFRFNRRKSRSRGKLFYRLIQQAMAIGPTKGREIIIGKAKNNI
jgi:transposase-like protein/ribosomal protein L37AE/L43A